jgi:hypothetical protein
LHCFWQLISDFKSATTMFAPSLVAIAHALTTDNWLVRLFPLYWAFNYIN